MGRRKKNTTEQEMNLFEEAAITSTYDETVDPELVEINEIEKQQAKMDTGLQDVDYDAINEDGIPVFERVPEKERRAKYKVTGIPGVNIDLTLTNKIPKEIKQKIASVTVTRRELRCIVDRYYQVQDNRMRIDNRIRAIEQGADDASQLDPLNPLTCDILRWDSESESRKEKDYKTLLDIMTDNHPVTKWLKSITGIGPIFAAALYSYLDVTKSTYATGFIQYAGLNDHERPWISAAKAAAIVQDVMGNRKEVTDEDLFQIAAITKWPYAFLERRSCDAEPGESLENKKRTRTKLVNAICIPPYNVKLKRLCYLIGESFIKTQNRGSLYGRIFAERKVYELQKNANGEYAAEAAKALASKNWDPKKDAYKSYASGKLPLAHINARARRYAVKLFICHVFEEMYRETFHAYPPAYYIFEHPELVNGVPGQVGAHNRYIKPEVPYTWGKLMPPQFDAAGNYVRYNDALGTECIHLVDNRQK